MPALHDIVTAVGSSPDGSAALEYKKGVHATGEGDRYEERVLALVFLRCLKRGLLFQLSANNGDADKFDDVVLVWRSEEHPEAHTLLVQLKHKTSSKFMTIHRETLLSDAHNSDFGIIKYCTSYEKIRKSLQMDRVTFVLLTNACLGDSSLSMLERQDVGSVPGLELLQAGGELYRLNSNHQEVWEAVQGNSNFIKDFYLLCQQRNSEEIVKDICKELQELLGADGLCISMCDSLGKSIREWMNEESVCLTRGWSKWQALVDEYIKKEVTECRVVTTRLKYCSVADVQRYVETQNPAWVKPPERGTEALSATKIHQALIDQTHIMTSLERFRRLRHQILQCWGSFCRWLVIVDDDREDNSEILSELETHIQTECRLIIVSSREKNSFVDTYQSSDISVNSWNECLDISVRLNGDHYECCLQDLVAGVDNLKSLLDGHPTLLLVLTQVSQPLRMGQELETLPNYYMPRKLVDRRLVSDGFFTSMGLWDVCVISSESYLIFKRCIGEHSVTSFAEVKSGIDNPSKFKWPLIVLTDSLKTVPEEYRSLVSLNVYVLKMSHGGWKILSFSGQPDRIREYAILQEREQLKALDTTSNTVIVEGKPGVGKSKMLSHVAKQIKDRDSTCWLLRVNLLEFYSVLDNSDSGAGAVEHILKRTVFNKGELGRLEYALLRHSLLQSPRVLCLVDGFDEVCPDYVNKCLDVLPLLAPLKGKLLVTTRPGPVRLLEALFGVLAHSLEPFSDSQVKKFLINYPSQRNILSNIIPPNESLRGLLRIPLFAEMFANLSEEIGDTYNIVTLYEAFFQNKFRRLYEEKRGDNLSAPGKKSEVEEAQKRHEEQLMLLAASVLIHSIGIVAKPSFDTDYFVKAGIVYAFTDGEPAFLHRTFAEHFLAKWCFLRDGEQNRVAVYREAFGNETLEFFLESFNYRAVRGQSLLEAVLDANEGKVEALLAKGADPGQTDACGRNALHLAAARNRDHLLSLLLKGREVGKGAISAEDGLLGWTPMRYALEGGHWLAVVALQENGADLRQLGGFQAGLNDSAQLEAVFRQGGCQALYEHVFQLLNNSSWKGQRVFDNHSTQLQFAASLIHANLSKEVIGLIRKEAYRKGAGNVCRLLLCAYR